MNGPIFERLQADMARVFASAPPANDAVIDLHAERVARNREASERRYESRHDTTGDVA